MKTSTGSRLQAAGLLAMFLLGGAACGKKGNPLPPLRPLPARVADAVGRRVANRVELRFTIPATNVDNSTPPAITRVDIYAAVGPVTRGPAPSIPIAALSEPIATSKPISVTRFPAARWAAAASAAPAPAGKRVPAPPTTAVQLLRPEFLRGHIDVKPPPPPPPPPPADATKPPKPSPPAPVVAPPVEPADSRPAAGDVVTFADDVTKERADISADRAVLRYIVVPVAGRSRLGTPSVVLEIPLELAPAPPAAAVATYDEHLLKIVWTAAAPADKFRVYRSDPAGNEQTPALTPTPLAVAEYTTPVEFGVERCFIVRSVLALGAVSLESEASTPVCRTAVDTFPPPAPTRLFDQPFEGKISLGWAAVDAPDLAGYLVLRADGNDPTMRPLMTSPVTETAFVDTTTRAGTVYTYAVVAVDKAGNRSPESNRIVEPGR